MAQEQILNLAGTVRIQIKMVHAMIWAILLTLKMLEDKVEEECQDQVQETKANKIIFQSREVEAISLIILVLEQFHLKTKQEITDKLVAVLVEPPVDMATCLIKYNKIFNMELELALQEHRELMLTLIEQIEAKLPNKIFKITRSQSKISTKYQELVQLELVK
jgi:hypothetical protein